MAYRTLAAAPKLPQSNLESLFRLRPICHTSPAVQRSAPESILRPLRYRIYPRNIRSTHAIDARCHQSRWFSAGLACKNADKDQQDKPHRPLADRLRKSLPPALHENVYTLPNILTFSRLLSAPLIGYLLVTDLHIPALSLFIYAGFTDLIDGWLARRYKQQTVVGTVIDPMADKTLMTAVTVALAWKGAMPLTLAGLILGRDALLGVAAIYYRYISLPPPKTLARFWDFSLPSAEVHPTGISKVNTALQLGLIGWTMCTVAVGGDLGFWGPEGALGAMWWLVGTTTVWSGASYIYTKDAVKILGAAGKVKSGR